MKLQDDPTIERLRLSPDDQRVEGIESDRAVWPTTDGDEVPVEDEARPKPVMMESDLEIDTVMAQIGCPINGRKIKRSMTNPSNTAAPNDNSNAIQKGNIVSEKNVQIT